MFGLVLVIGIVVDDAIVVVENVSRLMDEESLPPREAAIKAMHQVTGPIIATTLVLLAVFVPTTLLGGITGRLYQQFGITISVAMVFSSINALTLSPALCALFLRRRDENQSGLTGLFYRFMKKTTAKYKALVSVLIRKTAVLMAVFAVVTIISLVGLGALPTGFVPDEDEGIILVNARLPDGATLLRTHEVTDKIGNILENTPGINNYVIVSGFSILDGARIPNGAICFASLKPWSERTSRSLQLTNILQQLQMKFFSMPDAFILAFAPPPIRGLGRMGGFEMQLQDRGGLGLAALQDAASNLIYKANSDPVLTRLNSTFRMNIPQLFVDVDRVKAKSMGVPLAMVFDTLQTYLGSSYINDFTIYGRTFKVIAQADENFRTRPEDIGQLEVRNLQGQMLPIRTFATVRDTVGPQSVTHYNLYPSTSITGSAVAGYSSGQAIDEMRKLCSQTLPSGMNFEWSGLSLQEIESGSQASKIFLIAAVFAFLFLAAQYESWTIPLAIIFAVPLALLGAVLFTWARSYENNIYTQIGIVLLIGIASKTAILLVEFAKKRHDIEGYSIEDSAVEASRLRFRPILMTALTFVFGTVPLVIASGAGASARRALGTAVFGGMLLATITGVLMIPVFYVAMQKFTEKVRPRTKSGKSESTPK
jgi:HAE1 family hydrophobic/amphiphilic exporter-1